MTLGGGDDRPAWSTDRLGALSDGVFAIVLTLLVLDLKIPELPDAYAEQQLVVDLEGQIPNFLGWLISFILLARLWIVHHAVVVRLERCHVGTMIWNFIVLGLVSLVPFAAALLGTYEFDPAAITLFAVILGSTGVAIGLFARHAVSETHLLRSENSASELRWHWKYHVWGLPAVAALSVLLVHVDVYAALAVWLLEPIVAFISALRGSRRPVGAG